ncbi:lysylphosphatidylglycerol synthase transmembrane domain-containing protein [Massilia sp. CMS3.1]|uniref:lysylphosphatidylglycerol synthase transmembrane domain-containing protein n=1 Tax=Massilia sp. CMS3.1 TaxID=3373083 RepID=UPI003EE4D20D
MTEGKKSPGWLKHAAGALITIACVIVIARQVKLADVLDAIKHFEWPYLVLAIAFLAGGYLLRIVRWSLLLGATGAPVRFGNCVAPFLGSIALNNVLPLRLGDLVRAFVFPAAMGVPRTTATSSLVMERLIDLMTLLCCLAIGLFAIRTAQVPPMLSESALTLAVLGGLALVATFLFSGMLARMLASAGAGRPNGDKLGKVMAGVSDLLLGFEAMSRLRVLATTLVMSMLIWVGESGLFYFMMLGCGLNATPSMALLVMAIATLSTLVPSSPGYVGPFHLAAFTAISLVGGTAAQAGSFAVLCHLALWLPTTLAGATAILLRPELFRRARVVTRAELPIN